MHEQDHPPRLHERHAGAGVSPLPPHRARRPAFPGQTYKKQEESVALLLGILPLVADQRGGFFFSAGIGRGAGLDRRPAAPDVGPGGQIFGSTYPTGGRGCSEASGRSAPVPRLPGGGPHFSREMGKKRAGATPLDPGFYGRSFPLAGFGDCWLWYGRKAITTDMLKPIWDAFSSKIC